MAFGFILYKKKGIRLVSYDTIANAIIYEGCGYCHTFIKLAPSPCGGRVKGDGYGHAAGPIVDTLYPGCNSVQGQEPKVKGQGS